MRCLLGLGHSLVHTVALGVSSLAGLGKVKSSQLISITTVIVLLLFTVLLLSKYYSTACFAQLQLSLGVLQDLAVVQITRVLAAYHLACEQNVPTTQCAWTWFGQQLHYITLHSIFVVRPRGQRGANRGFLLMWSHEAKKHVCSNMYMSNLA